MDIQLETVSVTEGKRKLTDTWTVEYEPSEIVSYAIDEDGNEIGYNINGNEVSFIGYEAIQELTKLLLENIENDN